MIDFLATLLSPIVTSMGVSHADLLFYLKSCSNYIYIIIIAIAVLIAAMIAAIKVKKELKLFVRGQSFVAFLLVVVLCVNGVCYGPLKNTLASYLNAAKVELAEDTVEQSVHTIEKIGEEGMVLLKNEDHVLPLSSATTKLNVFGWDSICPLLGGTGSSASSAAAATDILTALADAGYETNETLTKLYRDYCNERGTVDMFTQDLTLPEPTAEYYTEEIIREAKDFSDVAVVCIGRMGGENYDLPVDMHAVIHGTYNLAEEVSCVPENYTYMNAVYTNNGDYDDFDEGESYLELSNTEEMMIDLVCSNFEKVVVLINSSNTMELGWVDEHENIDAVILAPSPGTSGFKALGEILNGSVNPSGKTTDTFIKDLAQSPAYNNIGVHSYTNVADLKEKAAQADSTYQGAITFLNYVEGIYVGYKFYETAAEEGLIEYENVVQYPFGYGLSYTTFEKHIKNFKVGNDKLTFEVEVKNTGEVAGKDVVEIYYTPPYYNGGIEKASVNLIDFEKTDLIEAGQSQTLHFSIAKEELASYDSEAIKLADGGYILEAGDYIISVRSDAHIVEDEESFTIKEDIDYSEIGRDSDDKPAINQFQDYSRGEFEQLSRADGFANYETATAAPSMDYYVMSDEVKEILEARLAADYDGSQYDNLEDIMPTTDAENDLQLADLVGADYEDDRWELLLDQMSIEDMTTLVNWGGWQTAEIQSIGKIATSDCDGPAGLNNFITGAYGTSYPSEVLIGQTWSKDMAAEVGTSLGSEFAAAENYGWYGPAMNIHRSAFSGRNFEYFSEDAILSGYMAAAESQGAAQFGVYPYLKHFVLNDQEDNRCAVLLTYASEQAIREIYLKPFECAIKNFQGKALAVMSSYNFIGTESSSSNHYLLNDVLREEWGFIGMVITDYDGSYGYMISDASIRNGNDLMLGYGSFATNKLDTTSATLVNSMRTASKNILYTVVNSGYYSEGTPMMTGNNMNELFHMMNIVAGIVLGVFEIMLLINLLRGKKWK